MELGVNGALATVSDITATLGLSYSFSHVQSGIKQYVHLL